MMNDLIRPCNIGVATFEIDSKEVSYKGQVDQDGKAFGEGTCTHGENPKLTWQGTFKENMLHGVGRLTAVNFISNC